MRIAKPSYLDVGAHHPFELSNTALLYQRGSRGINIEANPDLIAAFRQHRPEDQNICAGVGPRPGAMTFYRINQTSGCNSFVRAAVEDHGIGDAVELPVVTLASIVADYAAGCWPDLLSIDIEGLDLPVLYSADFREGGPKVICIEAVSGAGDISSELREMMPPRGYFLHSWCGSNMLFVRAELKDWLY
jgi:FkbM family methyltransferase